MKNPYSAAVLALVLAHLLFPCALHAQDDPDTPPSGEKPDTMRFAINATNLQPVSNSRYRYIELIDERPDSPLLGLIGAGGYYDVRVQLAQPMGDQLRSLMSRLVDGTAGGDTLALQLRRFYVYSVDKSVNVYLRFNFFAHSGLYNELSEVDTVISARFGGFSHGYRQRIQDMVSTVLAGEIRGVLTTAPDPKGDLYAAGVVAAIDEIKKTKLPLYHPPPGKSMPDGVYTSYASFSRLTPDYVHFSIDTSSNSIEQAGVVVAMPTRDSVRLAPGQIYAFVKDDKAYVSMGLHYAYMLRQGSEFYIRSYVSLDGQNANMTANLKRWAVYLAGALRVPLINVWEMAAKKPFWMQLDYRNGLFVPVRLAE